MLSILQGGNESNDTIDHYNIQDLVFKSSRRSKRRKGFRDIHSRR